MALYVGEAVRIRASAVDPETGLPLNPAPTAAVDFWAPGKSPLRDAADRANPDLIGQGMSYRTATSDFILFQATTGPIWIPGKWTYRVTVTGAAYSNWEYGTFILKA